MEKVKQVRSVFPAARVHTERIRLSIINNNEIPYKDTPRSVLSRKVLSPVQASGRMLSQYVTRGSGSASGLSGKALLPGAERK